MKAVKITMAHVIFRQRRDGMPLAGGTLGGDGYRAINLYPSAHESTVSDHMLGTCQSSSASHTGCQSDRGIIAAAAPRRKSQHTHTGAASVAPSSCPLVHPSSSEIIRTHLNAESQQSNLSAGPGRLALNHHKGSMMRLFWRKPKAPTPDPPTSAAPRLKSKSEAKAWSNETILDDLLALSPTEFEHAVTRLLPQ